MIIGMAAKRESERRRSYNQYCSLARSLDVIGDRWTLLLIRDLLVGPKRYKDLLDGLPGIGTNLLADRLHELEAAGLVSRRALPPPSGSTVYELTDDGQSLEPVVAAMAWWGLRFIGRPRTGESHLPGPYFMAMRTTFRSEVAGKVKTTFEFEIDERYFTIHVNYGRCVTRQGRAEHPDVALKLDISTFNALLLERLSPADALASGRVKLEGDPRGLDRFVRLFSFQTAQEHVKQGKTSF
jgi:DNA-binding HxlR family transcriptional regulator/putative sterol carrier protein